MHTGHFSRLCLVGAELWWRERERHLPIRVMAHSLWLHAKKRSVSEEGTLSVADTVIDAVAPALA